eukprot:2209804-Rhodomonas_salina.2
MPLRPDRDVSGLWAGSRKGRPAAKAKGGHEVGAPGCGSEGAHVRARLAALCGRELQSPAWAATNAMLPAREAGRAAQGEAAK